MFEFGAAVDEVVFAPTVGSLPVVSADPYLNKLLITYCEEALARRPANLGSFRSVVENVDRPAAAARESAGCRNRS